MKSNTQSLARGQRVYFLNIDLVSLKTIFESIATYF